MAINLDSKNIKLNNIFVKSLFVIIFFSTASFGKKNTYLNYSQAGDVYHILVALDSKIGSRADGILKKYWKTKFNLSLEDENHISKFNEVRKKFVKEGEDFNRFSLAFYKADSVDGAVKKLKKILKGDDLKTVVESLRHIKTNASVLINESQGFKGKIASLEKKLKKKKVYKTYEDAQKFFGFKKNLKAKVFFVWWPKEEDPIVEVKQNIIFIKAHPLSNIESLLEERFLLEKMIFSLFQALPPSHLQNFEKTVFPTCKKENFYKIMGTSMGYMHFASKRDKKKFDPFKPYFENKDQNSLALMMHFLYESESRAKRKFYGEFANKVKFVCDQLSSN